MSLAQVYTAVTGHVITAARWNNEFGNIYANGVDLAFPITKAVSLAGWTFTLDVAGATTLSSTASQGFIFASGSKAGTPGVNGSFMNLASATFTDSNTAASGTAAQWNAATLRAPTLAATNVTVTTTDAATLRVEAPVAGTNQTLTNPWAVYASGNVYVTGTSTWTGDVLASGAIRLRTEGTHTNTVLRPFTVQATTTGAPAAGIGTGIAFASESGDESPSSIGHIEMVYSDVTAGTEDSYFSILLRSAGAAADEAYRFVKTTAFASIFTHANTAARTYTFQNRSGTLAVAPTLEALTSGTSWTVPAGVTGVDVTIFGASGGGGGGGEGGVGDDGAAGGAGGTTSFDTLTTTGGAGGFAGTGSSNTQAGSTSAAHGVGSVGTVNRTGGGQSGGLGGEGGQSAGIAGTNGGQGGDGGYVRSYLAVTPGASITYAIGTGGTAGAGGTGNAGPDGGAGRVGRDGMIVLEY